MKMKKKHDGRDGLFRAKGDQIEVVLIKDGKEWRSIVARSVRDAKELIEYYVLTGIIDDSSRDGQA
tara:strand:+ start:7267 stop:7464 length:198 start_codon:yes stop_codon:yes gene_type:complete